MARRTRLTRNMPRPAPSRAFARRVSDLFMRWRRWILFLLGALLLAERFLGSAYFVEAADTYFIALVLATIAFAEGLAATRQSSADPAMADGLYRSFFTLFVGALLLVGLGIHLIENARSNASIQIARIGADVPTLGAGTRCRERSGEAITGERSVVAADSRAQHMQLAIWNAGRDDEPWNWTYGSSGRVTLVASTRATGADTRQASLTFVCEPRVSWQTFTARAAAKEADLQTVRAAPGWRDLKAIELDWPPLSPRQGLLVELIYVAESPLDPERIDFTLRFRDQATDARLAAVDIPSTSRQRMKWHTILIGAGTVVLLVLGGAAYWRMAQDRLYGFGVAPYVWLLLWLLLTAAAYSAFGQFFALLTFPVELLPDP